VLPIWIGPGEASAIAMELAGMKFARPLTHDLAASLIRGLGGALQRVLITRVQDNTYYAELVIQRGTRSSPSTPGRRTRSRSRCGCRRASSPATTCSPLSTRHLTGAQESGPEQQMTAEQLQEYLRKLNPEDLGRFNP
jgi:uncharacterized protein